MTTTSAASATSPVHGSTSADFTVLRDAMAANLASGDDLGAAVAVVHDGSVVADLWGG